MFGWVRRIVRTRDDAKEIKLLKDLVYRQSRDVGQCLQFILHTGQDMGRKERPPEVFYITGCQKHKVLLQEIQTGHFLCPHCQTGPMSPITEAIPTQVQPGEFSRFYKEYQREHGAPPGHHTLSMEAINLHKRQHMPT